MRAANAIGALDTEAIHWVGDAPTSLHGNGAGSLARTTRDAAAVTCRLCLSILQLDPPAVPARARGAETNRAGASQVWERPLNHPGPTRAAARLHLDVNDQGRVTVHEAVLAQLLADAGWERAVRPPRAPDSDPRTPGPGALQDHPGNAEPVDEHGQIEGDEIVHGGPPGRSGEVNEPNHGPANVVVSRPEIEGPVHVVTDLGPGAAPTISAELLGRATPRAWSWADQIAEWSASWPGPALFHRYHGCTVRPARTTKGDPA